MLIQEVLKTNEKLPGVAQIATLVRRLDVFDNHVPDGLDAVRLLQKRVGQAGSDDIRDMLVLGNGPDFSFVEAAQCDAIMP
jgi:hypothetical protein